MQDLSPMAASVAEMLKARGETVAVSESSCGGLISAALVSIAGASNFFLGGAVSYTQASREGLIRITEKDMEGMRASTES